MSFFRESPSGKMKTDEMKTDEKKIDKKKLELLDFIKKLSPAKEKKLDNMSHYDDFFEWKLSHETKEKNETFREMGIKRIRLIASDSEGLLEVSFMDSDKKLPSKQIFYLRKRILMIFKSLIENAGIQLREWSLAQHKKLDWSKLPEYYADLSPAHPEGSSAAKDYQILHKHLLNQFEISLKNILHAHPEYSKCNIVDAGCGQAPTLAQEAFGIAEKLLPGEVKVLGFDFEQTNVNACLAYADEKKLNNNIQFIVGDSNKIDQIIKDSHLSQDEKKTVTSTFFAGSATVMTLNDRFECLDVLHASRRTPIQILQCTGESQLLFNERMLDRVGYKVSLYQKPIRTVQGNYSAPTVSLEYIPEQEMIETFQQKLAKKPTILDLALSTFPHVILNNIPNEQLEKIEHINLSFCDIRRPTELAEALAKCKNLKTVEFNYHNPSLICQILSLLPKGVTLKAKYTRNEKFLLATEKFVRRVEGKAYFREEKETVCFAFNEFTHFVLDQYQNSNPNEQKHFVRCLDMLANFFKNKPNHFEQQTSFKKILFMLGEISQLESKGEDKEFFQFINEQINKHGGLSKEEESEIVFDLVKTQNLSLLKKIVLEKKVSLDSACQLKPDIFIQAIDDRSAEFFDLLKEYKVDIRDIRLNKYDNTYSLLEYGAKCLWFPGFIPEKEKILKHLIHLFPELLNLPNKQGDTCLIYSVKKYCREAIPTLLDSKADLRILDASGFTFAHIVPDESVLDVLLKAGVSFLEGDKDKFGRTPFEHFLQQALGAEYLEDWSKAKTFNLEKWKWVLKILLHSSSESDHILYHGKKESLNKKLSELAELYSKNKAAIGNGEAFESLFLKVATKFKCQDAIQKLQMSKTQDQKTQIRPG